MRWLRPEFQNPGGKQQTAIAVAEAPAPETKIAKAKPLAWPKELSKQAAAVQAALAAFSGAASAEEVAKRFGRATKPRIELIEDLLETLATLGKARELDDGRFISA